MIGPIEESMGGAGPAYRDSLIRRAGAAASSIDWIGLIAEPHLLASHLQSAAILVYPSIDESGETFGVAALEALACGCPTIVSDLRCFGDYLIPGNTGFRFSHRSTAAAQELRSLLVRLIADDELRRSCAKRGWEATERFLLPQIAGEFVREFEIMIQDR
jgi:glycosyltransferase involved in cell wall biosynthesis